MPRARLVHDVECLQLLACRLPVPEQAVPDGLQVAWRDTCDLKVRPICLHTSSPSGVDWVGLAWFGNDSQQLCNGLGILAGTNFVLHSCLFPVYPGKALGLQKVLAWGTSPLPSSQELSDLK